MRLLDALDGFAELCRRTRSDREARPAGAAVKKMAGSRLLWAILIGAIAIGAIPHCLQIPIEAQSFPQFHAFGDPDPDKETSDVLSVPPVVENIFVPKPAREVEKLRSRLNIEQILPRNVRIGEISH